MAMIGRKPFNPNAYVPPVNIGAEPLPMGLPLAEPSVPTITPRQSFFGQGGVGRAIAGNIGDFLLQLGHMQPIYGPARDEQTAFERGEEQYHRHRQDSLNDALTLYDYKAAHPDDQLTQYLDQAGITDPAQRQQYYRQKADALTAPPMMSAMGTDEQGNPVMRFFPRAQPIAPSAAPAPTVGTIKNGYRFKGGNPASPDAWEPAGGASSGSRTFP